MSTPLADYLAAVTARQAAERAYTAAQRSLRAAEVSEKEQRNLATVAVRCPYCEAAVGEQCRHPDGFHFHRYVTHGMRDDLAGVNGERMLHRARQRQT